MGDGSSPFGRLGHEAEPKWQTDIGGVRGKTPVKRETRKTRFTNRGDCFTTTTPQRKDYEKKLQEFHYMYEVGITQLVLAFYLADSLNECVQYWGRIAISKTKVFTIELIVQSRLFAVRYSLKRC